MRRFASVRLTEARRAAPAAPPVITPGPPPRITTAADGLGVKLVMKSSGTWKKLSSSKSSSGALAAPPSPPPLAAKAPLRLGSPRPRPPSRQPSPGRPRRLAAGGSGRRRGRAPAHVSGSMGGCGDRAGSLEGSCPKSAGMCALKLRDHGPRYAPRPRQHPLEPTSGRAERGPPSRLLLGVSPGPAPGPQRLGLVGDSELSARGPEDRTDT